MTALLQQSLRLKVNERTALVTVETARAALGVDAETIWAMIETGEILWAWDIAAGTGALREIRVWAPAIIDPARTRSFSLTEAVEQILPSGRDEVRATEVAIMLGCSRPLVMRLLRAGELSGTRVGHSQRITCRSLSDFLHRRRIV